MSQQSKFDGFVRSTPANCDHDRGPFDRCDVCAAATRRVFEVWRRGSRVDITCVVLQGDSSFSSVLSDLTDAEAADLTARFADAGWCQTVHLDVV